jgi:hypothetical protein
MTSTDRAVGTLATWSRRRNEHCNRCDRPTPHRLNLSRLRICKCAALRDREPTIRPMTCICPIFSDFAGRRANYAPASPRPTIACGARAL